MQNQPGCLSGEMMRPGSGTAVPSHQQAKRGHSGRAKKDATLTRCPLPSPHTKQARISQNLAFRAGEFRPSPHCSPLSLSVREAGAWTELKFKKPKKRKSKLRVSAGLAKRARTGKEADFINPAAASIQITTFGLSSASLESLLACPSLNHPTTDYVLFQLAVFYRSPPPFSVTTSAAT